MGQCLPMAMGMVVGRVLRAACAPTIGDETELIPTSVAARDEEDRSWFASGPSLTRLWKVRVRNPGDPPADTDDYWGLRQTFMEAALKLCSVRPTSPPKNSRPIFP
jgi:hypothetical protein